MSNAFWDDLTRDLEDPEFRSEYITESIRIATIDSVINSLDDARESEGLSKADVARALRTEPATIRRLFSSTSGNPTLGTLAEAAAVVGMRITVEPMTQVERSVVTDALRNPQVRPARSWTKRLHDIRSRAARHKASS